jgi:hypothetical protein
MNNLMFTFEDGLPEPYIDFIYRFDSNLPWGFPHSQFGDARDFMKWRAIVDYYYYYAGP